MSCLPLATVGEIAIAVAYVLGAAALIGGACFAVVKAFGGSPGRRKHKRGTVGAGEETVDPGDGTPHSTDN